MTGPFRLAEDFQKRPIGRLLDRDRRLAFTFDGTVYSGLAGDTLASALLANGVSLIGRSFKYHRPRGILTCGVEEPNALVTVGSGNRSTPNLRAPVVELFDGLEAHSQNRWPSLRFDVSQINGIAARLLPAGFYYKTFMWPASAWPFYERLIRRAAGLGPPPREADPDRYEQMHITCDVLVAGGGAAGIAAALAAAETGARVILAEQDTRLGGASDLYDATVDGKPALERLRAEVDDLAARDSVHILTRTTVTGHYDHNFVLMAERLSDHDPSRAGPTGTPRERLWKVRAKEIVVATGAIERPLTFADNDRPGVMLASAARAYAWRYGVSPGRTGVVFANNDEGYRTALALAEAGVSIARIVDVRSGSGAARQAAEAAGLEVSASHAIADVETAAGGARIKAVQVAERRDSGRVGSLERIGCDFVAVSGGWNPVGHLTAHVAGRLAYDDTLATLRPDIMGDHIRSAGASNGVFDLAGIRAEGFAAGDAAARAALGARKRAGKFKARGAVEESDESPLEPYWFAPSYGARSAGTKHFVDQQNDVTAADVELAVREGYRSVEHLKRYTTLGMATDQGKIGNVNALAIHAEALGVPIAELGTTTFRPPYTPLTFGAIAGAQSRDLFQPVRQTPVWAWHAGAGADVEPIGLWRRPYCYPGAGQSRDEAIAHEIRGVRERVGVLDASTLGKIEVSGPDAGAFLDLIYSNMMSSLAEGRCRYGLMLNEQGFLFDDGVVVRLGPDRFLAHTTSGGADHSAAWMELWHQTEWPHLKVFITPVTEQWAQFAIAGPQAREVLQRLDDGHDWSNETLPFLSAMERSIRGVPMRIFRISFTGELSYEVACPANHGAALWDAILEAGAENDIVAYGTEALHVMRAEKGFIAIGDETDGTITPLDLGLGWAVSKKKADFIGKRGLERADLQREGRRQLVGLLTDDPKSVLPDGAYAIPAADGDSPPPHKMMGYVTSTYMSPTLGRSIALAMIDNGRARHGEAIALPVAGGSVAATIVEPVFYDREGTRQNA